MIDLGFMRGHRVGVVGLGKSGIAVARALAEAGADVVAWDDHYDVRLAASQEGVAVVDLLSMNLAGFTCLVWSPGIPHTYPEPHPLALHAQSCGVPLICDVELLCFAHRQADFIGITGTNGKSTTTALIGHILSHFRSVQVGGNIGVPVSSLEPLGADGSYVIEMSSYQLELTPSFSPVGAVLLNVTPDHLGRHGGLDGYIAAKAKIFDTPPAGKRKPIAVICVDTPACAEQAKILQKRGDWIVIPVSTTKALEKGVYVAEGKLYEMRDGKAVMITAMDVFPTLKGQHNHENAACAYALTRQVYGYEPRHIVAAMKSFAGLQHRQFPVRRIAGVEYINDSKATNADATSKALVCYHKIYWILGGQPKEGGLQGLEPLMNRVAHAYLIGEAAPQFAAWLHDNKVAYTHCGTLDVAVDAAHRDAQNHAKHPDLLGNGVVLLSPACASWDQFTSFEHRGQVFCGLVEKL